MKVAVQTSQLGLQSDLFLESEDVSVHHIASEDMLDVLHTSLCHKSSEDEEKEPEECYDCIILNTDDTAELNHILEFIISSTENITRRPRFLLLSKLLSWGGRKYKVPIGCSISEFNARNPYLTEDALYKVENRFQTCAALTKLDMCIVGVGLIYGSGGFDFHSLCKSLFLADENAEQVVFSTSEGGNTVPMIHHTDLLRLLEHLATMPEAFPSFFVPAVDFSTQSLASILAALSRTTRRKVRCTTEAEALEEAMSASAENAHHKWDFDLSFADSHRLEGFTLQYPSGLTECTGKIWREFQQKSCSPPCSVLLTGPPSSLKTTIAKDLAEGLGLKYIDWVTSVTNCLTNFFEKPSTESVEQSDNNSNAEIKGTQSMEGGSTIDLTKVDNAHVALRLEIERCIRVYKKMKDDAPFELGDVVFDKALLATLPKNLVTEAIAAQLQSEELCLTRGYVLDVWGGEEKLLVSKHQLYEITNTKPPKPQVPVPDGQVEETKGGVIDDLSMGSLESFQFKESATEEKMPRLIVELQCDAATSIKRFLEPQGIVQTEGAKMSKEHVAIIKETEGRAAHYMSLLQPLPVPVEEGEHTEEKEKDKEPEPEVVAETKKEGKADKKKDAKKSKSKAEDNEPPPVHYTKLSHPLVQQCETEGYAVVRIDVNDVPPPPSNDKSKEVAETEKDTTKAPVTEDVAERKDGIPGQLQVDLPTPEVVSPTAEVVREIYQQYAQVYGPLDWVNIEIHEPFPPSMQEDALPTNETPTFEAMESFGAANEEDVDLEELHVEHDEDDQMLAPPTNRVDELNTTLQSLGTEMCSILQPSAEKLNQYLVENVLQHVAEALVIIHRERIEDPVFFLSDFLRKRGEELEVAETQRAYEKYVAAVKEAEMLEQEAANELQVAVESSCDEWD